MNRFERNLTGATTHSLRADANAIRVALSTTTENAVVSRALDVTKEATKEGVADTATSDAIAHTVATAFDTTSIIAFINRIVRVLRREACCCCLWS